MSRIGQANEKYAMDMAKEMEQRFRDGTLNYHYQPEHRLYEGGPKAKFRNNVEAIRLILKIIIGHMRMMGYGKYFDRYCPDIPKKHGKQ